MSNDRRAKVDSRDSYVNARPGKNSIVLREEKTCMLIILVVMGMTMMMMTMVVTDRSFKPG